MTTIQLEQQEWTYDPSTPLAADPSGFGSIFIGHNSKGQEAVIKVISNAEPRVVKRELAVAASLSGTDHPHIIPIYDFGIDTVSGRAYLVMARAEQSLEAYLRPRGTVEEEEAIEILDQILAGLQEADVLIHRDLKPQNVLLHDGTWKIADFGLARLIDVGTSAETMRGWGTAHYKAPEQFKQQKETAATDIYALGCIAHRLRTEARGGVASLVILMTLSQYKCRCSKWPGSQYSCGFHDIRLLFVIVTTDHI